MASLAEHMFKPVAAIPRHRRRERPSPFAPPRRLAGDDRDEAVDRALARLRESGRRAISILDLDCGEGRRLIAVATRARALGFVAIEACGFDRSPIRIAAARAAAQAHCDPAIGWHFERRGAASRLPVEDHGADIVLAGAAPEAEIARILESGGSVIRRS